MCGDRPSKMRSETVKSKESETDCRTKASRRARSRGRHKEIACPSTSSLPTCCCSPPMQRKSVVLPLPFGPSSPVRLPDLTRKVRLWRIGTSSMDVESCSARTAGAPGDGSTRPDGAAECPARTRPSPLEGAGFWIDGSCIKVWCCFVTALGTCGGTSTGPAVVQSRSTSSTRSGIRR